MHIKVRPTAQRAGAGGSFPGSLVFVGKKHVVMQQLRQGPVDAPVVGNDAGAEVQFGEPLSLLPAKSGGSKGGMQFSALFISDFRGMQFQKCVLQNFGDVSQKLKVFVGPQALSLTSIFVSIRCLLTASPFSIPLMLRKPCPPAIRGIQQLKRQRHVPIGHNNIR